MFMAYAPIVGILRTVFMNLVDRMTCDPHYAKHIIWLTATDLDLNRGM